MTFDSLDSWWWPFLFILLAGWLATDIWRLAGVVLGGRLADDSDLIVLVRCMATALVAAVIARLVVFPDGALAATPLALRVVAAGAAFAAYLVAGKRVFIGIIAGETVFLSGLMIFG